MVSAAQQSGEFNVPSDNTRPSIMRPTFICIEKLFRRWLFTNQDLAQLSMNETISFTLIHLRRRFTAPTAPAGFVGRSGATAELLPGIAGRWLLSNQATRRCRFYRRLKLI